MRGNKNAVGPRPSIRGNNNPMKRSDVSRKSGETQKGKPRPSVCGDKNPMKREEVKAKIRGGRNPMSQLCARARVSEAKVRLILAGKLHPEHRGKSGYFDSVKNGKCFHYRSSYELLAYQRLETDETVSSFTPEPFSIPYTRDDGSHHRYIPDILVTYLSGRRELIEVSAGWELERKHLKLHAGKLWCRQNGVTFVVWSEEEVVTRS